MKIAIILAGGDGTRAGGDKPKQFQLLDGEPVVMHSVKAFHNAGADRIYIVLHPEFLREWDELLQDTPYRAYTVCGGKTRWHSVKNALTNLQEDSVPADAIIAIHDGARPLINHDTILRAWDAAITHSAAIPVIKLTDSIRKITGHDNLSKAVDRNTYRAVQTPQAFKANILISAYSRPYSTQFTDDASVVEADGYPIHIFPGDDRNIKITNPDDIKIAQLLLQSQR